MIDCRIKEIVDNLIIESIPKKDRIAIYETGFHVFSHMGLPGEYYQQAMDYLTKKLRISKD